MNKTAAILLAAVLIAAAGSAVYRPALEAGFYLDDLPSIVNNHAITDVSDLGAIWNFWPTRFLTYLTLALNYHRAGLNPASYRVFNVVVHLAAALLVYLILLEPVRLPRSASLAGALFFLLHPVQTQAVTYIVQRAASLAALFYLATIFFYFKSFRTSPVRGWRKTFYLLALISAAAAFLSKEYAVTLPFSLLLIQRLFGERGRRSRLGLVPFFVLLLIFSMIVFSHRENPYYRDSGQLQLLREAASPAEPESPPPVPVSDYFRTQPRVALTYLRLVFYPVAQQLDYDYPFFSSLVEPPVAFSLAVIAALLLAAVKAAALSPPAALGTLWFFLALLPESSLVPILDPIAEHRLYLPLFGPALLFGLLVQRFILPRPRFLLAPAAVILCLAALTFQRNRAWTDPVAFWEDNAARAPGKARVVGNLGKAYLDVLESAPPLSPAERSRYRRRAVEAFERVLEIDPRQGAAHVNLGVLYIDHFNDYSRAEEHLRSALELYPGYAPAHLNLGVIRLNRGELEEAIEKFKRTLEFDPRNQAAFLNLSACYINLGRLDEGADWVRRGLAIWPEKPAYYERLALIARRRGEEEAAARYDRQAAELRRRRGF